MEQHRDNVVAAICPFRVMVQHRGMAVAVIEVKVCSC
jgi:hypothetical protein